MFRIKNIVSNKAVVSLILVIQLLFPLYSVFASQTGDTCNQLKKEVKKHCCCCDENSSAQKSCTMENNLPVSHSISKCDCIHKSDSADNEVTTQQNYELNKIIAVEFVDFNFSNIYSNTIIQKIHSLKSLNGPPIYLSSSTLLI